MTPEDKALYISLLCMLPAGFCTAWGMCDILNRLGFFSIMRNWSIIMGGGIP